MWSYGCIRVLALRLTPKHLEQEKASDSKAAMSGRACNPRMIGWALDSRRFHACSLIFLAACVGDLKWHLKFRKVQADAHSGYWTHM